LAVSEKVKWPIKFNKNCRTFLKNDS